MRGLPLIQNARIADKMGLFGHLRRFEKIRKKAYIIYIKFKHKNGVIALSIVLFELLL